MAYDPVQRLIAIGSKNGSLRMYPFILPTLLKRLWSLIIKDGRGGGGNLRPVYITQQRWNGIIKMAVTNFSLH